MRERVQIFIVHNIGKVLFRGLQNVYPGYGF